MMHPSTSTLLTLEIRVQHGGEEEEEASSLGGTGGKGRWFWHPGSGVEK